jgi:membrane protease YdiL (CAAX protease family)
MNPLQLFMGALLIASLFATVFFFPKKYGSLSGKSFLFRTTGMVLLDLLLLIMVVIVGGKFAPGKEGLLRMTLLYIAALLVGIGTVGVALLDSLETYVAGRRARREQNLNLIEETIAKEQDAQREKARLG